MLIDSLRTVMAVELTIEHWCKAVEILESRRVARFTVQDGGRADL